MSSETSGTFQTSTKLDNTLALLHAGPTGLAASNAVHTVEIWEAELQAAGRPELGNIARDLAALRVQLTSGALDGTAIGEILLRLGDQTIAVSGEAQEEMAGKLHTLGELLIKSGHVLAPAAGTGS